MSRRETFWALTAIALLVFAIGAFMPSFKPATATARAAAPVFGWQSFHAQELAMTPGENLRPAEGTTIKAAARFKLSVTADQPVSIGLDSVDSNGGHVICGASSVFAASPSCEIEKGAIVRLFIKDERKIGAADVAIGGLALWARNSKPLTDATSSNRVKLELFTWACIANCAP